MSHNPNEIYEPDVSGLNNDGFSVRLGSNNHMISHMSEHSGLHCHVWAATRSLLDQFGIMAMQDVFVSIYGDCINAVADALDSLPEDTPLEAIDLLVDLILNVSTFPANMHAVIFIKYRMDDPPGLTIFIAIVENKKAMDFMLERVPQVADHFGGSSTPQ